MTTSRPSDALAAAGIARSRQGGERLRALTDGQKELYRWILHSFGAGTPPGPGALAEAASELEVEVEPALERLRQRDLVHQDPATGEILVAYPFSGRPTAHRVRFDGREVYAMCAIDALGIAPMLGESIEISSRDPLTAEEIRIELAPDGRGTWQPGEAVVVSGRSGDGRSSSSCCPVLNFFADTESAQRWLATRADVRGVVISMEDAIATGRIVFGDVLKER